MGILQSRKGHTPHKKGHVMNYNYKLLKRIKESAFETQKAFARSPEMKVPEHLVGNVINGRWNLTPKEKEHWAKVLDTSVEELFDGMVEIVAG